jgi:stage V sporulation protein G
MAPAAEKEGGPTFFSARFELGESQPEARELHRQIVSWLRQEGVPMQVTEVRVFPVDEDKLRAYVTITLDHCFVIRDLKIIRGTTGYFVSMPSKKRKDGTYKDIAHPINNDTRRMIEEKIIAEYHKVVAEGGSQRALGGG